MKIALTQLAMHTDPKENLRRCIGYLRDAAGRDVRLICFPELQFSPFFPQYRQQNAERYLMDPDDSLIRQFRDVIAEVQISTVANLYLETPAGKFDASPVFGADGSILGISKMVHIVQIPRFYEQDYYTPSDEGFAVYDTGNIKVGVVICFDRHFPESIRSCVLLGAEVVAIPTAIVDGEPLEKYIWEMRIAAMQNRVYIALCNRTGPVGDLRFCGNSVIVDPDGELLARAGPGQELLIADIDPAKSRSGKAHPYFSLRRPGFYVRDVHDRKS